MIKACTTGKGKTQLTERMSRELQSFFDYLYGSVHNSGRFTKDLLEKESNVVLAR